MRTAEETRSNIVNYYDTLPACLTFHPIEPGTGQQHAEVMGLPSVKRLARCYESLIDS